MISYLDAIAFMEQYRQDYGIEVVRLQQCQGRILARDVVADRDFPPFERVTMDGIAISVGAFESGCRSYKVEKVQAAGAPQQTLENAEQCIEVMTGAILPGGTDAVVPYEDCEIVDGIALLKVDSIRPYQNVHRQGTDSRQGDLLLSKGRRITPAMTGVLASVGLQEVDVLRLPRAAVCSTGDELVAVDTIPEAHQIRRSNSYMLDAALREVGMMPDVYHLPDEKALMLAQVKVMLERYEVLIFSGAVSKGKYDFLPEVLREAGVQTIFHKVAQRPGKPFLFGKAASGALVFGFPGNPASTLVCFYTYFLHWLHASLRSEQRYLSARLSEPFEFKPALTLHLLVTVQVVKGELLATPAAGANSGDMVALAQADGILRLPAEVSHFEKGEVFPLILLRRDSSPPFKSPFSDNAPGITSFSV